MNEAELRNLMYTAQLKDRGPFAIRYPRGRATRADWESPFEEIEPGHGELIREGKDVAILSIGHPGNDVMKACAELEKEGISAAHFNMRYLKPIDTEILHRVFRDFRNIITVEDGTIVGGFGSAVLEFMAENNYSARVERLGVPDRFVMQGTIRELHKECGYDAEGITGKVKEMLNPKC
jgi:1-deoxy-D-xylulose-5-phosphate synthase